MKYDLQSMREAKRVYMENGDFFIGSIKGNHDAASQHLYMVTRLVGSGTVIITNLSSNYSVSYPLQASLVKTVESYYSISEIIPGNEINIIRASIIRKES